MSNKVVEYLSPISLEQMAIKKDTPSCSTIQSGSTVDIVTKADQRNGKVVRGIVKEVLTNTSFHPHGIKVRLTDGRVGRVQMIIPETSGPDE
jgi:uncharacterized repeat protein (TIGR03833 family)